jgi:hypothetical protein
MYQAEIRKEKHMEKILQHISEQPWNEAYKFASGKTRNRATLTTLQKPDGSKTANVTDTLKLMMEQLIPEDDSQDDTDHHMNIRRLTE